MTQSQTFKQQLIRMERGFQNTEYYRVRLLMWSVSESIITLWRTYKTTEKHYKFVFYHEANGAYLAMKCPESHLLKSQRQGKTPFRRAILHLFSILQRQFDNLDYDQQLDSVRLFLNWFPDKVLVRGDAVPTEGWSVNDWFKRFD